MFLALQECHTQEEDIYPGNHGSPRDSPGRTRLDIAAGGQRRRAFCVGGAQAHWVGQVAGWRLTARVLLTLV